MCMNNLYTGIEIKYLDIYIKIPFNLKRTMFYKMQFNNIWVVILSYTVEVGNICPLYGIQNC